MADARPSHVTIPIWIVGYAAFLAIIPILATSMAIGAPDQMFGTMAADVAAAAPVMGLYLSRNAGLLVLAGLALWRRTPTLLSALFAVRLVVDLLDLAVTVALGFTGQPAAVLVASWVLCFTLPQLLALRALRSP